MTKQKPRWPPAVRCVYCDDYADTRDHVPPLAWSPGNTRTVAACRRCNCQILHSLPLLTVKDRRAYVQARLAEEEPPEQATGVKPKATPGRQPAETFTEWKRRKAAKSRGRRP